MSYAIACKSCGNVLSHAWEQKESGGPYLPSTTPLTEKGRVPVTCPRCGAFRSWRSPATADDITKFEAAERRRARATELARTLDIDGLLKVPDEVRASPEVKNALSNLFGPLEGETLKVAQALALKVARSGVVVESDVWIELYDRAVTKAIAEVKEAAKAAKGAKAPA